MEIAINIPLSDSLSSWDKFVQDLRADPKISPNLLQAAINTVIIRSNTMQSAQATPTSSS